MRPFDFLALRRGPATYKVAKHLRKPVFVWLGPVRGRAELERAAYAVGLEKGPGGKFFSCFDGDGPFFILSAPLAFAIVAQLDKKNVEFRFDELPEAFWHADFAELCKLFRRKNEASCSKIIEKIIQGDKQI
ncbi:MAG: hypothetical protein RMM53_01240 [Bacteroidia bacterium]|nr:hypothetical protein [Bacteroidia bacterium]MDW8332818.1 hypothetical protein [Bacteroidia bacterium]